MRQKKSEKRAEDPKVEGKPNRVVYDSMKAASAGTGIPMELLKKCKGAGCKAFKGGRVDQEELEKWMDENPNIGVEAGESLEYFEKEKLKLQYQLLGIKVAQEEGKYILKEVLDEIIPKALSTAVEIARRHMDSTKFNAFSREINKGFEEILTPANW